ncbi:MAG: TetR/AcrR family transcriptional regulator [Telmatospirillum sp.]|nr:TetR/AcrR family transcriptional regulator [Telmatospirillum sp.]
MKTSHPSTDVRHHILETAQRLMGQRGFTAVGLSELLKAADVPKGSFYHYFESKEVFGEALLENYFAIYQENLNAMLAPGKGSAAERLMSYWSLWSETQASHDPDGKCLAVKLGAEVCDLSDAMRSALQRGMQGIIGRLARAIGEGQADGSLMAAEKPDALAETLYFLWLGASLMAKVSHDRMPMIRALATTRRLLGISGPDA